tara:strand:- start:262 stop:435 length:174 start_codon:yes stop_codon:yes gene_type:complete
MHGSIPPAKGYDVRIKLSYDYCSVGALSSSAKTGRDIGTVVAPIFQFPPSLIVLAKT